MQPVQLPLKDIHLPEAIGWWPPAVGWWILAVLIPVMLVLLIVLYKRITRKTAIKDAKKILNEIKLDPGLDDYQKLCQLSVLMRRTAISHYPRTEVASLTSKEWLLFLQRPMQDKRFTEGVGKLLTEAPYMKSADNVPIKELTDLCEDWLKALVRFKS